MGHIFKKICEFPGRFFLLVFNGLNMDNFKELYNTEWVTKLMFFMDITLHLNYLKKLQGHGKTIELMFGLIKRFECKLGIFARDAESEKLINFPKLKTISDEKRNFNNKFSKILYSVEEQF